MHLKIIQDTKKYSTLLCNYNYTTQTKITTQQKMWITLFIPLLRGGSVIRDGVDKIHPPPPEEKPQGTPQEENFISPSPPKSWQ